MGGAIHNILDGSRLQLAATKLDLVAAPKDAGRLRAELSGSGDEAETELMSR